MRARNIRIVGKPVLIVILFLAASPLLVRAQVGIVNGLTQEKICKPGEIFESYIRLKNNGPKEETVKIYQTDYLFSADGKTFYDAPGKVARSNAAWIAVAPKQLTIAGLATVDVKYACKVPASESLIGTYWSIIMFEVLPPGQRIKGEPAGKIEGERWRIFPGTSVRYRFDVSSLKQGVYNALIVFDNKDASVFGAQYKLNVTEAAPPAAAVPNVKKGPGTAAAGQGIRP